MAEITLHNDKQSTVTLIPNDFIDTYMTTANGEYVKIYLYLLRCLNASSSSFTISEAADRFEHTEKDIIRALKYWEKIGLLRLSFHNNQSLSGIYFLDSDSKKPTDSQTTLTTAFPQDESHIVLEDINHNPMINNSTQIEKPDYSLDELKNFQDKEDIKELIFITEQYLGRTLTQFDLNKLFFWYDELNFKVDLIEYLIEHCVGKGHKSMQYMNKVALAWSDTKVTSIEEAKLHSYEYSKTHYRVMNAFGIKGRNLIPLETALINKWSKEFAFTDDIISEACSRTILQIHQPSFDYANTVLERWHKAGIKHLKDIASLDSDHQKSTKPHQKPAAPNKFNNFSQRTYDFDNLEKQLLGNK